MFLAVPTKRLLQRLLHPDLKPQEQQQDEQQHQYQEQQPHKYKKKQQHHPLEASYQHQQFDQYQHPQSSSLAALEIKTTTVSIDDTPRAMSQWALVRQMAVMVAMSFGCLIDGTVMAYASPALPSLQLPTSAVQIDDLALSWIGEYTLPPCLACSSPHQLFR